MARRASDGLSKHATKGYRISIGKKPNGKFRTFWLGQDRGLADHHAAVLRLRFDHVLRAEGREVWTAADLDAIKLLTEPFRLSRSKMPLVHSEMLKQKVAAVEQAQAALDKQVGENKHAESGLKLAPAGATATMAPLADPSAGPKPKTLYDAIGAFLESIKGKRVSSGHRDRFRQILEVTLKRVRPDCPMSDIDFIWVDRLCDHFKSRPASGKGGEPIKVATVLTTLRYLRLFFAWCDDSSFGGWEGPRKLMRPFKVRAADLMTPAEVRASGVIQQFSVETLCKLYRASSDRQRAWMLTALFTGATQQELAVLEKAEFNLDAQLLVHYRNKTGIQGRFWLPPELVPLLNKEFKRYPGRPLAFYSKLGQPLISFDGDRKTTDVVTLAWKRIRKEAETPTAPSFKYIRKFVGDYATRAGGESMGQVALSHASSTVLGRHYSKHRDFDGFHAIQKRMHAELRDAGMFVIPPKVKKSTSRKTRRKPGREAA